MITIEHINPKDKLVFGLVKVIDSLEDSAGAGHFGGKTYKELLAAKEVKIIDGKEPEDKPTNWIRYFCSGCNEKITTIPELNRACSNEKCKGRYYPEGFVKDDMPKEVAKYFNEKDLLGCYTKEAAKFIAGEEFLVKALTLQKFGGAFAANADPISTNALIQGGAGFGKDYINKSITKLKPSNYVHYNTRISEKVLNYLHNEKDEPYFNWNGHELILEDITNEILNSPVLKTMMSGGSKATITKDSSALELTINGKPITSMTAAYAAGGKEQDRRVITHSLNDSQEQTEAVLQKRASIAKYGKPKYDDGLRHFFYCLQRVEVKVDFAKQIANAFPKELLARSGFDQFIDFIRFSAALNQYHRERNSDKVIANAEDYTLAREIFQGIFKTAGLERLTPNHKILLDYFKEQNSGISATSCFAQIGHRLYTQINNLIKGLNSLANKGLLKIEEHTESWRSVDYYSLGETKEKLNLPSYEELMGGNYGK